MSIYYIEDKNGDIFSTDGKRRFIRLSGKAAYEYLSIHRGKRFYKLTAEEDNEDSIFVEVPPSKVRKIRKGERYKRNFFVCNSRGRLRWKIQRRGGD